jgi:hypothetical protein
MKSGVYRMVIGDPLVAPSGGDESAKDVAARRGIGENPGHRHWGLRRQQATRFELLEREALMQPAGTATPR